MISDASKIERTLSLASQEMYTVALQCRRLRSKEPEDSKFIFRWWADLQFLIVSLTRLRRSIEIAKKVSVAKNDLAKALKVFDRSLPDLKTMRNVGEHIDNYANDQGRNKNVNRRELQVGSWDGTTYIWLGKSLNIDDANRAGKELFQELQNVAKKFK